MPKKKEYITPIYTRKANARYDAKFKKILLRVSPELKEKVEAAANGKSVNQYIIGLILADFEKKGISLGEEKTTTGSVMPDGITEEKPFR